MTDQSDRPGSKSNRLVGETSPYLLQHATNPVDWYPWGDEAIAVAIAEDKPIFLSIGYSACHWCHVMERESFEDSSVAEFMNEHFICVKVDREERPDIDNIYMEAVQLMTGQGGWPMSVWLTPELKPFYAGTYFPPRDRWGRPSFLKVLTELQHTWSTDRAKINRLSEDMARQLHSAVMPELKPQELSRTPIERGWKQLDRSFDPRNGGFGQAPKFPPSMQLRFLLHVWADSQSDREQRMRIMDILETTLVRMASGGIYDHLGGGFHRYSVDEKWLIPHFEKMLCDNALITLAYLEAYQASGRQFYARIVRETLGYVLREMVDRTDSTYQPFFSSQDADIEEEEGKFFVWTPEMLEDALGDEDAVLAMQYWGVSLPGNFEAGASVLNRLHHVDEVGEDAADSELEPQMAALRQRLFAARFERARPRTDTKILASWNGLMISAMVRAGVILNEEQYLESAKSAASFIIRNMVEGDIDGTFQLLRTYKDGRARFPAYLDDYANMAVAYLDLFEATSDLKWLKLAERLVDRMITLFYDKSHGGFYFTALHHTHLLVRQKEYYDGATPSGNAMAVQALLRLSAWSEHEEFRDYAEQSLQFFYSMMMKHPQGMTELLQALDSHIHGTKEVLILCPENQDVEELLSALYTTYHPHTSQLILNTGKSDRAASEYTEAIPMARDKRVIEKQPTVYVCHRGTCQQPTSDPDVLRQHLHK